MLDLDSKVLECIRRRKMMFYKIIEKCDIATYDDEMTEIIGSILCRVAQVIIAKEQFEYIEQCKENYLAYLIATNFFDKANLINWGTSIRGAWFENEQEMIKLIDDMLKEEQ